MTTLQKIQDLNFFNLINKLKSIFLDVISSPADSRPYKVYTALLTQTGTNDPTVIVLENTLNFDINWSRQAPGIYWATTIPLGQNLLPFGKTFGLSGGVSDDAISGGWTKFIEGGSNYWELAVFNINGIPTDEGLIMTSIEIRIYN